jgi:hypothetical protein
MTTFDRLSRAVANPRLFARGFNRLFHRRAGLRSENTDGVSVFDEDWDTLVVLDACRYDMFESTSRLDGSLSSRLSRGSSTVEWLEANFDGRDLSDTVYVTANPQLEENRDRWDIRLHETINVWLDDGWDDETGTVRAETLTEAALEAADQFPHKRLVVHYMQPHSPYIAEDAPSEVAHDGNVKARLRNGEVSHDLVWQGYLANLRHVLADVALLLENIDADTVAITSDHGEGLGELGSYGHTFGWPLPVVRKVPWVTATARDEKTYTPELWTKDKTPVDIEERLENLGYK